MGDCADPRWRELLPDLVSGGLADEERASLSAHLDACRPCREELALLTTVHAMRPAVVVGDVARLVSALPAPKVRPLADAPSLRRPSAWGGVASGHASRGHAARWRVAAALMIAIGAGVTLSSSGSSDTSRGVVDTVALADPLGERSDWGTMPLRETSVSYGNLDDLTEGEMQQVLSAIEQWDGATSTEGAMAPLVLTGSIRP